MTAWTEHIKAFAKEHNISYGCALSNPDCSASYRNKRPQKLNKKETKEVENMGLEEPTGIINRTNSKKSATHKKRVINMKSKLDNMREANENQEMSNNDIPAPPSRVPVATAVAVRRKVGRPKKYNTAEEARKMKIVQSIASNKRRANAKKQSSMSGGALNQNTTISEAYNVFRNMVNMWNTHKDYDEIIDYYEDNFFIHNDNNPVPFIVDFNDNRIEGIQMDAELFTEHCEELLMHDPFIMPNTFQEYTNWVNRHGLINRMREASGDANTDNETDSDTEHLPAAGAGLGIRNTLNPNDSDTSSDGDSGEDSDDGFKLYPISTLHIAKIVGSGAGASTMTDENRILLRRVLAELSLNVANMQRQAVPEREIDRRINRDDFIERLMDTALREENHPQIDREVARLDALNLLPTAPNTPR